MHVEFLDENPPNGRDVMEVDGNASQVCPLSTEVSTKSYQHIYQSFDHGHASIYVSSDEYVTSGEDATSDEEEDDFMKQYHVSYSFVLIISASK